MITYPTRGIPYNTKTWTQVGALSADFSNVRCICSAGGIFYCAAVDSTAIPNHFHVFSLNYSTNVWTSIYTSEDWAYPIYLTEMSGSLYSGHSRNLGDNVYKLTLPSTWTGLGLPAGPGNIETQCLIAHSGKLYYTAATSSLDTVYEYQSGTTWASVGTPVPGTAQTRIESCGGSLYSLARDPAAMGNIIVKVWAGGTTWNAVATITPAVAGGGFFFTDGVSLYITAGGAPGEVYRFTAPSTFTKVGVYPTGVAANVWGGMHEGRLYLGRDNVLYRLDQQDGSELYSCHTITAGYEVLQCTSFNGKLLFGQRKSGTASAGQVFELGLRHQGT